MRIAYFIMVHKSPRQIAALYDLIYDERDLLLFHVDRKADSEVHDLVRSLVAGQANVRCLPSMSVNWGGWSQCQVELSALAGLCDGAADWDYFINLSGQDLPIVPIGEIRDHLSAQPGVNYIDVRRIADLPPRLQRIVKRRDRFFCVEWRGKSRRLPLPLGLFNRGGFTYYGSSWHMLARDFCDWIARSEETAALARRLRHTRSPDEFLLQELVMASPFKDRLDRDNRRLALFDGRPNPRTLRLEDLPEIDASAAFFARKFDLEVDAEIVREIGRRQAL